MMKQLCAALAAVTLVAAAPSPAPSGRGATLSVVCQRTPLWVFVSGSDRPTRAQTPDATLGQRFGLVGGPRTTLTGDQFYQTDIVVVDPGFPPGTHFWIKRACAIPSR